jgi:hypothetical protein
MLKGNTRLKELDVSSSGEGMPSSKTDGSGFAKELAVGIQDNEALIKLDISGNNIGGEQAGELQRICVASGIELAKAKATAAASPHLKPKPTERISVRILFMARILYTVCQSPYTPLTSSVSSSRLLFRCLFYVALRRDYKTDILDQLVHDLDENTTEEKADRLGIIKKAGCSYLFTMKQLVQLLQAIGIKSERM